MFPSPVSSKCQMSSKSLLDYKTQTALTWLHLEIETPLWVSSPLWSQKKKKKKKKRFSLILLFLVLFCFQFFERPARSPIV